MLAPVVSLIRQFDRQILSYQSIPIAEGWELGPWDTVTNEDTDQYAIAIRLEESKVDPSDTPESFSQKGKSFLLSSREEIMIFLSHAFLYVAQYA